MSVAKSFNPVADYERHAEMQERRAQSADYTLYIDDLLKEPVEVDGVIYDLHVRVWLKRKGLKGKIEISSFEAASEMNFRVPQLFNPVYISRDQFRSYNLLAWNRLENTLELMALKLAAESKNWEQEDTDE